MSAPLLRISASGPEASAALCCPHTWLGESFHCGAGGTSRSRCVRSANFWGAEAAIDSARSSCSEPVLCSERVPLVHVWGVQSPATSCACWYICPEASITIASSVAQMMVDMVNFRSFCSSGQLLPHKGDRNLQNHTQDHWQPPPPLQALFGTPQKSPPSPGSPLACFPATPDSPLLSDWVLGHVQKRRIPDQNEDHAKLGLHEPFKDRCHGHVETIWQTQQIADFQCPQAPFPAGSG